MHEFPATITKLIPVVLIVLISAGCLDSNEEPSLTKAERPVLPKQRSMDLIADEYMAAMLQRHPELGTMYSLPGVKHDGLTDYSASAIGAWEKREDAWLQELEALGEPEEIGSRDWVSYGILHEKLTGVIAGRICRDELWQASAATGWHVNLPSVFEIQPIGSADLQQQVLDRLSRVPLYIDTQIENLREGLALGYSTPRVSVSPTINQIKALLEPDSPFLSPAARSEDLAFQSLMRAQFDQDVVPAINRLLNFLESEYLPQTREGIGLDLNTDGTECYAARVRLFTTIEPAAEKIHQVGLAQVASIRVEFQTLIDEHFQGETIESLLRNVNIEPQYTFKTEAEVLKYSQDALQAAKAKMAEAFSILPKADVLIKPYPPYRKGATGEYHSSSEDGTRPGIYYMPVTNPTQRSRAVQQSVLYHETYPGHHLQGAIALELGDRVHPIARYLWNSGYGEGWALYSERLADELGLYITPLDHVGLLSDQAARAARLVVDTGLHTRDWTRQQAIDYLLENSAWPAEDVESEVNRYIAWPGQATAYMLGMLEIRRLRDLAEAELGEAFDLRVFHDRVLGNGSITLPMLDATIRTWIAQALPVAE
jgi:uncharacterized protein (DUF885 family)